MNAPETMPPASSPEVSHAPNEVRLVEIVDADAGGPPTNPKDEPLPTAQPNPQGLDRSTLTLSMASLALARDVRQQLEVASDGDPAESILEGLVAGEMAVAHELQNMEGAATALLGRTLGEPLLALHVAKLAREIFALSTTIRGRIENTLGARADLRAQRLMMSLQRARFHD